MSNRDLIATIVAIVGYLNMLLSHVLCGLAKDFLFYAGAALLAAASFYFGAQLVFLVLLIFDIGVPHACVN